MNHDMPHGTVPHNQIATRNYTGNVVNTQLLNSVLGFARSCFACLSSCYRVRLSSKHGKNHVADGRNHNRSTSPKNASPATLVINVPYGSPTSNHRARASHVRISILSCHVLATDRSTPDAPSVSRKLNKCRRLAVHRIKGCVLSIQRSSPDQEAPACARGCTYGG